MANINTKELFEKEKDSTVRLSIGKKRPKWIVLYELKIDGGGGQVIDFGESTHIFDAW